MRLPDISVKRPSTVEKVMAMTAVVAGSNGWLESTLRGTVSPGRSTYVNERGVVTLQVYGQVSKRSVEFRGIPHHFLDPVLMNSLSGNFVNIAGVDVQVVLAEDTSSAYTANIPFSRELRIRHGKNGDVYEDVGEPPNPLPPFVGVTEVTPDVEETLLQRILRR